MSTIGYYIARDRRDEDNGVPYREIATRKNYSIDADGDIESDFGIYGTEADAQEVIDSGIIVGKGWKVFPTQVNHNYKQ